MLSKIKNSPYIWIEGLKILSLDNRAIWHNILISLITNFYIIYTRIICVVNLKISVSLPKRLILPHNFNLINHI